MKIALCLQGLSSGLNDKGDPVSFDKSAETIKKNIIDPNNADVFIHSWGEDSLRLENIKSIYSPKSYIFEKQIPFPASENVPPSLSDPLKYHSTKSRWYSHEKSLSLKKQYEEKNGFKYDFVIVSRFDAHYFTLFNFEDYDPSCFYSSNFEFPEHKGTGLNDVWFFGGSDIMDEYSNIYENVDFYLNNGCELSNHAIALQHLKYLGREDKLRHTKVIKKDYQLSRKV